jgi:hypothetical protein
MAAVEPVSDDAIVKAEKHEWSKLKRVCDSERQA